MHSTTHFAMNRRRFARLAGASLRATAAAGQHRTGIGSSFAGLAPPSGLQRSGRAAQALPHRWRAEGHSATCVGRQRRPGDRGQRDAGSSENGAGENFRITAHRRQIRWSGELPGESPWPKCSPSAPEKSACLIRREPVVSQVWERPASNQVRRAASQAALHSDAPLHRGSAAS
jgi:hypothetical protein